jgi:hypothetical protein
MQTKIKTILIHVIKKKNKKKKKKSKQKALPVG